MHPNLTPERDNETQIVHDAWLGTLPEVTEGQFLIPAGHGQDMALFCVRELTWYEALDIETRAFRTQPSGDAYFAEAYERRETLSRAIIWAADLVDQRVERNVGGTILNRLRHGVVEALAETYFRTIRMDANEAQALYAASKAYFEGRAQDGHPIPPIVVEVDLMLKFGGLSRQEMRAITVGELERIQLVLMARAEVLRLVNPSTVPAATERALTAPAESYPPGFFPPGVNPYSV